MIVFFITLFGMIFLTLIIQLISKMKIIGGNELAIVSGKSTKKGFITVSGGRIFIFPFFNKFEKIILTPYTIEVTVESAIANGIVPLNVKATVSFSISSTKSGREKAATRIKNLSLNREKLCLVASSIIEGHLRDAIAPMTPEQLMKDKDTLIANMINICKSDLENIGLEITTMNIADVDDHRLEGIKEKNLYIDLLKRIQTTNAEAQARIAKANADASAAEQEEARRAETEVRKCENMVENILAETRVKVAGENQKKAVGMEQALKNAEAICAGIVKEIESEKQKIEMLEKKYEAEIITPSLAERDRKILHSRTEAASFLGTAEAELEKLLETINILSNKGEAGATAFIIDNFEKIIQPFAKTMELFKVKKIAVMTGASGHHDPISAIHPHAIDETKNTVLKRIFQETLGMKPKEVNPPVIHPDKNKPGK